MKENQMQNEGEERLDGEGSFQAWLLYTNYIPCEDYGQPEIGREVY